MKDLSNNLYLFDCFGVIISDVSRLWLKQYFNQQQRQDIIQNIYTKVDIGEISFAQHFRMIMDKYGCTQEMVDTWDSYAYPLEETLQVISQIKSRGGTVALVSNASVEYIDKVFTQFGLHKYFDKLFVSAAYRCIKPNVQLFQIALDGFPRKFQKVYFTDDNPENLVAPQTLGIKAVQFTTAQQLIRDLEL